MYNISIDIFILLKELFLIGEEILLQASKYLESQISSEPLWSRGDSTRSDIKLLSISPTSQPGGDKPEKCDDVTTLKDNSVLIDSSTVYKGKLFVQLNMIFHITTMDKVTV